MTLPEPQRKKIINHLIFKQLQDVAGARGQNGTILLNKAILNNYLKLKETLLALANRENDPYQIYWQHIAQLIQINHLFTFKNPLFNNTESLSTLETFSEKGLLWRLILQLRIHQQSNSDKIKAEALIVEKIVGLLYEDKSFLQSIKLIQLYDEKAPHTLTYFPAILATLMKIYNADSMQKYAENAIEFAIKIGMVIQGQACESYLNVAEKNPTLLQSPLNFNDLNGEIAKNPEWALQLYNGEKQLTIDNNTGKIIIEKEPLDLSWKKNSSENSPSIKYGLGSNAEGKKPGSPEYKQYQQQYQNKK